MILIRHEPASRFCDEQNTRSSFYARFTIICGVDDAMRYTFLTLDACATLVLCFTAELAGRRAA